MSMSSSSSLGWGGASFFGSTFAALSSFFWALGVAVDSEGDGPAADAVAAGPPAQKKELIFFSLRALANNLGQYA
jgi:hypothetical protein